MLTAYVDELNQAIRTGLERRGLTVVHMAGLGITDNFGIGNVTPGEIVAFAERNWQASNLICCSFPAQTCVPSRPVRC